MKYLIQPKIEILINFNDQEVDLITGALTGSREYSFEAEDASGFWNTYLRRRKFYNYDTDVLGELTFRNLDKILKCFEYYIYRGERSDADMISNKIHSILTSVNNNQSALNKLYNIEPIEL